jgi:hypothetical protein
MARYYNVTFRHVDDPDADDIVIKGYGNTRASAERNARGTMRREGHNNLKFFIVSTEFVKAGQQ